MVNPVLKMSFFLLIISFFLMTLAAGYLTGISMKYFAISTKNHFLAFFHGVINFFQVF
jgi:hypothetical protein